MHIYTFEEKFSRVPVLLNLQFLSQGRITLGIFFDALASGITILNEFRGVRELSDSLGAIASFLISSFWRPDQWRSATVCLFLFPETPEKQHSAMSVRKDLATYFITTCQTQVKEFKPPIKTSFSSTTSCRQRWACSGRGQSSAQPSRARRGAERDGAAAPRGLALPDANSPSGGILHQQKLQDLVKGEIRAACSCKRKVRACSMPFESALQLPAPPTAPEVLNIQQFWKSWHLP